MNSYTRKQAADGTWYSALVTESGHSGATPKEAEAGGPTRYAWTPNGMMYFDQVDPEHAYVKLCDFDAEEERLRIVVAICDDLEMRNASLRTTLEAAQRELDEAVLWNHRVAICANHVHDIVDRECVICALSAAEQRAGKLEEALELHMQWIGTPPTDPHSYDSLREEAWAKGKSALTPPAQLGQR